MKLGLALGSGGGRGLVHIGVLRALEEANIQPKYIAGSSIGALIGAMFAAGRSSEEIEKLLLEDKWSVLKVFLDPGFFAGLIHGRRLKKYLKKWLGTEHFSDLKTSFAAVACDLKSGELEVMQRGNLVDSVRASMAVPGLFKAVKIGGKSLVDGGVVDPVPDTVVKKMGATKVLAVNLDYRKVAEDKDSNYGFAANVTLRSINIMRHYLAEYSLDKDTVVLNPEIADAGIIGFKSYFDKEKSKALIDLGYKLTKKEISKLS
jgi:NTE family protein